MSLAKQVEELENENRRLKSANWGNAWLQRRDGFGKPFHIDNHGDFRPFSSQGQTLDYIRHIDIAENIAPRILMHDSNYTQTWERVTYRNTDRRDACMRPCYF